MTTFMQSAPARLHPARRLPATGDPVPETELLANVVQTAARSGQAGMPAGFDRRFSAGLAFKPQQLLALLTYCYARQIYSSALIAQLLRRDLDLIRLCPEGLPDPEDLRRFRGENREALLFCLKTALRFLLEKKVAAGVLTKISETQLAEEASRRIITAVFLDSMGLEGD